MSAVVLVKAGKQYYRVRVNPIKLMTDDDLDRYASLMRHYIKAKKNKRLALMIRIERRIVKMERDLEKKL
jgi:hypothetical protein